MSDTNTPASTSTSVIENESVTLAGEIKKYETKELIDFLRKKEDLKLSQKVFEVLEKEEINGPAFLKITKEELRSIGLGLGPAMVLADFAKECKKKKKRAFSSYRTNDDFKEVISKYKVNQIEDLPQFVPGKFFRFLLTMLLYITNI